MNYVKAIIAIVAAPLIIVGAVNLINSQITDSVTQLPNPNIE